MARGTARERGTRERKLGKCASARAFPVAEHCFCAASPSLLVLIAIGCYWQNLANQSQCGVNFRQLG
jgi:hypothetical protein